LKKEGCYSFKSIPNSHFKVAESGIESKDDIKAFKMAGANAF